MQLIFCVEKQEAGAWVPADDWGPVGKRVQWEHIYAAPPTQAEAGLMAFLGGEGRSERLLHSNRGLPRDASEPLRQFHEGLFGSTFNHAWCTLDVMEEAIDAFERGLHVPDLEDLDDREKQAAKMLKELRDGKRQLWPGLREALARIRGRDPDLHGDQIRIVVWFFEDWFVI